MCHPKQLQDHSGNYFDLICLFPILVFGNGFVEQSLGEFVHLLRPLYLIVLQFYSLGTDMA